MKRSPAVYALWLIFFAAAAALLYWSLRNVPLADVFEVLSALQAWQIITILVINAIIILFFVLRWWLILRAQGHTLPYLALARYRLAAFAISYFTPGQHFGGEPLQVLMLRQRHKVPGSTALASVTLDKVMELSSNFAVMAGGIAVVLASGILSDARLKQAFPISIALLVVPLFYIAVVAIGLRPLAWLLGQRPGRAADALRATEEQLGALTRQRPDLLLQGLAASALVWLGLFFEFWLMLLFLGLRTSPLELIAIVTAGRIAMLAPTPGALGALEASQVLAMQALGFDPAYGLSLSLLIRARDIFFALLGLLFSGLGKTKPLAP
jgi:uncharacterized protein (TIRG00374 family)